MKKINRELAVTLGKELQEILEEFAREHNLELAPIRGTFTETTLAQKVVFNVKTDDGQVVVSEVEHHIADMTAYAQGIRYEYHIIGTVITHKDEPYRILGLVPRGRRNNWRVMNLVTEETYRVSAEWIKANMK